MGRKKPYAIIENVEITDIAAEGNAIARVDNKILFVPQAIPGDIVDVQIKRKRTSYMEGYVVNMRKPSAMRVEPFCSHFGVCGGCKWQQLPYPEQLKYKQKQVVDAFERIAKVQPSEILPILASQQTQFYRNKLEYTFSDNRWLSLEEMKGETYVKEPGLGFHIPGMFDKVLDITYCYLQPNPSNQIRLAIREYALKNELSFYNIRNKEGLLRNLIIRNSVTGQLMVIVVFGSNQTPQQQALLQHIANQFPQITALMYVVNTKMNDVINDLDIQLYKGNSYIVETMEQLQFKVGPKSFYQTNSLQAYELYKVARNMANLTGSEVVYDLYTGTGTIANFVAKQAKQVVGIEYVPEAIVDAIENSRINNISNTLFFAGDMKDVLTQSFIDTHGRPDVMIIDPPRAGMHDKVIEAVLYAKPNRIVYVSCNPATQARDIALLSTQYSVKAIQPVDMFPHTHHVENVALLSIIRDEL